MAVTTIFSSEEAIVNGKLPHESFQKHATAKSHFLEKHIGLPHPEYTTPRGISPLISVPKADLQYPNYTPFKLPELVERLFIDRAIDSDPKKAQLLGAATEVKHLTPAIGTELVDCSSNTLAMFRRMSSLGCWLNEELFFSVIKNWTYMIKLNLAHTLESCTFIRWQESSQTYLGYTQSTRMKPLPMVDLIRFGTRM